ncbi:MAG: NAD(P)H-hydrate dehydratase [Candidatus Lokiarchaeota archaeon]|nr:NAD(P)H-hydrate dehydratase [Candidatus Lokiarchaeota archaeon]
MSDDKIPAEEVGVLDNNSEWLGIPKSHLMECAGFSFTSEIINRYKLESNNKVAIFCGTGNNGGDGFVVARHLAAFGIKSYLILVGSQEQIRTPEARLNWDIVSKSLIYSVAIKVTKDSSELSEVINTIKKESSFKLVIDGLLGTGIRGQIREPISSAIDAINDLKNTNQKRLNVVSIDVPSGVDPNTGKVPDKAVKADLLITFHRNKIGLKEGSDNALNIIINSIGIPQEANLFVGKGDVLPTLKMRALNVHKGQFGKVLVVGGSRDYSGAPAYSTLACTHFGVDLVKTYVPESIGNVLKNYSPSIIVRNSPGDYFTLKALEGGIKLAEWADAILIGPGMGVEKDTQEFLVEFLKNLEKQDKPIVLDADALKLIRNNLELIKNKNIILTPHAGELKILTGMELPSFDAIDERYSKVMQLAKKLSITLLIKGPFDYISDGTRVKINRTGCPEMSIGGTGDVLAGLCAALCALRNDTFSSACSAAFLNGYIGEFCKKTIGPRFTTSDMILKINKAIMIFQN